MRSPVLPLTWHLARSSGRRGLQSQLLAAGAAAVGSFLLLVMIAAALGSGTRADHTTWRTPDAVAADKATAVQTTTTTYVRQDPVTVVNLAQLAGREPTPAPPGLSAFPEPGEVYVSPALAELLHRFPAGQLADRFPKVSSYGTIGAAGLASPDELVAVVGRAPGDAAVSKSAGEQNYYDERVTARATVAGFTGTKASAFTALDQGSVLLGVVLLVMPVVVLAAAAGRLGAARREQRLAALRLAGATPRQILAMTAVEAAGVGAAGALAGALAYTALLPALAQLPYGIGAWYTGQLWVGPLWLAGVVLTVTALITVSAVTMLRQVVTSPLGVAQQSDPRRTRAIRLVLFVAVLLYIWMSTGDGGQLKTRQLLALLALFYGAFWLFGPWVVDRLGRIVARRAKRPATLLAARRLSDDPRGAWRTVSGLVLAGFVAGFFSVSSLGLDGPSHHGQVAVITANAADARHTAAEARTALHRAGVTATVTVTSEDEYDSLLGGVPGVTAQVSGGQEGVDTAVTALTPLGSGRYPVTQEYVSAIDDTSTARIATVSTATLVLSFLVAAASAGLTAAANVLDRRRVYGLLRLSGTPLKVLDRARIRETVIPLAVLAGGTTAMGVFGAVQLNKEAGTTINTSGAVQLVLCLVVGAMAMLAAIAGSKPLLRRVTEGPVQTSD
ncbi:FtsX-like permease family protein [Streptomyces sp. SID13726]|uniref:FtsX-like permease family protein n=1 Tax=Streptomyces sp. SID13726 TaxID=2706058 RepID=UPI0013BA0D1E|nr:FtsX-like permease family protein [Streptomyces sp. SID13726]NEA98914.1 ABC transporter permease [Streptomyces sp. SID13726]